MRALKVSTALGTFTIALDDAHAPQTCAYFARLAETGGLDNSSVFRIVTDDNQPPEDDCPIHIVQLGPLQQFAGDRHTVPHENTATTGLCHRQWTVSAARFDLNELYGSFFICMRDEPDLDHGGKRQNDGQGFAAFGLVVDGFQTLTDIFARAERKEMLQQPIAIHSIVLTETAD